MKLFRYTTAILAAALLLTGCDDFLTEDLKGDYSSEDVMSTEESAQQAVNGIYNAAAYSINLWRIGDVASDDAVKGGNPGDQADLNYIEDFTATGDNGVLSEFWQHTYETISRANKVIEMLPGRPYETRDRMIAEARFLRAFSYFQLVNIFGSVPMRKGSEVMCPLGSVDDIYGLIESDLIAATSLPASYSASETGRATAGAAWAMLAKERMYRGMWKEALVAITELKKLNLYGLDDYAALFRLGNGDSPEAIFAIRFMSDQIPGVGNALNQWLAPQEESGYYFDNPTSGWVESFTERCADGSEDPRIDLSVGRDGKAWMNGNTFDASWSTTGFLVRKHNQPLSEVDKGRKGDGGLAYIYMRYADVLLIEAECQNELGYPNLAEAPLNEVRGRAGLAPVSGKSQSTMRDYIRTERRHELGFEFHRFFDLMRYGRDVAATALRDKGVTLPAGTGRFYFPIPQAELDVNTAIK